MDAEKSIVQIIAQNVTMDWYNPYQISKDSESVGTGFFIDSKHILTCAHVVDEAIKIYFTVSSSGKEKKEAKLISLCVDKDIALLEVINYTSDSWMELGDSDAIKKGTLVSALGYPLGQDRLKRTKGSFSGRQDDLLQTDTAINPGNSGGPLVIDDNNKVVGINRSKISSSHADNIGYATPIHDYIVIEKDMKNPPDNKMISVPDLGGDFGYIDACTLTYLGAHGKCKEGCYIKTVLKGSSLANAGLKEGNILCSFDGYDIDRHSECIVPWATQKMNLTDILNRYRLNEKVNIGYWDAGKYNETEITLIETKEVIKKHYPPIEKIDYEIFGGMVLMDLTINHLMNAGNIHSKRNLIFLQTLGDITKRNRKYVMITNILPGSHVRKAEIFRTGEIITHVNGTEILSLNDFRKNIINYETKNGKKYVVVKSKTNGFMALCIDDIVEQEQMLSEHYKYNKSTLLSIIVNNIKKENKNKDKDQDKANKDKTSKDKDKDKDKTSKDKDKDKDKTSKDKDKTSKDKDKDKPDKIYKLVKIKQ
jgi:S1-C subfamily serine protease